jgi:hypothetical protein
VLAHASVGVAIFGPPYMAGRFVVELVHGVGRPLRANYLTGSQKFPDLDQGKAITAA